MQVLEKRVCRHNMAPTQLRRYRGRIVIFFTLFALIFISQVGAKNNNLQNV